MRWLWIDRYVEFVSGKHATAIKNLSMAEDHLHDHFPGAPMMPNPLIIEGLAQTGGLLAAAYSNFEHRVVLAKLTKAQFYFPAVPGDTLTYRMAIDKLHADGAITSGTSHVGQRLQGEVQIVFAHLPEARAGKSLFDPADLLGVLRLLGVFDVGRDADGNPLKVPQNLLDAAQLAGASPA